MYYYKVYETVIASEIEILNLPVLQEQGEASAKIILVSEPSKYIPTDQLYTFYSPTVCALGCSWGTLEALNGKEIQIYLKVGHVSHEAAPFIIGWGLGFLFHQLGYTVFHCTALNIDGRGVIVSGVSGAGKSSTALQLIRKGAKYLADDMAVVHPDRNLELIPAYPIQKVCRDVSLQLKQEELLHINEGRDKFSYHNEEEYYEHPLKPTHLVLLRIHEGEELLVQEHKGINKWMKVLECTYLCELFAAFGTPQKEMKNCLKLAEMVRVLEVSRPRGKDTMEEITEIIQKFVNS